MENLVCEKCEKVGDVFTTLFWCGSCLSAVPTMSVRKADAIDDCAARHFMFPREPQKDIMKWGVFRHAVIALWIACYADGMKIDEAYQSVKKQWKEDPDPHGDSLQMVRDLSRWFVPPPRNTILTVEGEGKFRYPPKFQAPNPQKIEYIDRLGAVIVTGEEGEHYLWQFAHDLAWWDADHRYIRIKDWKTSESNVRNQKLVLAITAMKIWAKLKPLGVSFQAHGLASPWNEDDSWTVEHLQELEPELLAKGRRYQRLKGEGFWEPTENKWCGDCPGFPRCPTVNRANLLEKPATFISIPIEQAPTPDVIEGLEEFKKRLKIAEEFLAGLEKVAWDRIVKEGVKGEGRDAEKYKLQVGARVATAYMHASAYMTDGKKLLDIAQKHGIESFDEFRNLHLTKTAREEFAVRIMHALDHVADEVGVVPSLLYEAEIDTKKLIQGILQTCSQSELIAMNRQLEGIREAASSHRRITFSNATTTKNKRAALPKAKKGAPELPPAEEEPSGIVDPRESQEAEPASGEA